LRREQRYELLVFVVEVRATLLLRQIEVAVGDSPQQDRRPEKRFHRGMPGWEPDGARIVSELLEAQRVRVRDQRAEDAPPGRQVADDGARFLVDAMRDEPLKARARGIDHPESRVLRAGHLGSGLDDPLQHTVERQFGVNGETGLDQRP
jgi:hypothetical protein